ncbi:MAG: hypothetical protein OEN56_12330 [Gemmatimonadota bacterium]|nr:hypothetical protein [Gemmatimonadota bacterium]
MDADRVSPWLARGLYLFGLALIVTASIDLFSSVWPIRAGEMSWRYGFLGLAAGYLQTPMLGLIMIILTAAWQREATMLRAAGSVCLVAAVLLLLVMGVFGIDVMSMRQIRAEDAQLGVLVGGAVQEVKYFMAMLVFAAIGQGSLKTARSSAATWAKKKPGIVSTAK